MKKIIPFLIGVGFALSFAACGGGDAAENDPKLKEEIVKIEKATQKVDSTIMDIKKTEAELDALLKDLEAE